MNQNNQEQHSSMFNVLGQTKQAEEFPKLAQKLENYRLNPGYFKWFDEIYILYLSFNLNEMFKRRRRMFSFEAVSRPHTKFDQRFSAYVLRRIPSLTHREYFQSLLRRKCKSKFLTIKRNFAKGRYEDYIDYIPKESKKILNKCYYPTLLKALNRWQQKQRVEEYERPRAINSSEEITFSGKFRLEFECDLAEKKQDLNGVYNSESLI